MPCPISLVPLYISSCMLPCRWARQRALLAFCPATKMAQDIIKGLVANEVELQPRCLKEYIHPAKVAKHNKLDSPTNCTYIFVDDFIEAAMESRDGNLLHRMTCGILHSIHSIFPPPTATDHIGGKDPISVKKLHEKELLGFIVDGDAKGVRTSEAKLVDIIRRSGEY